LEKKEGEFILSRTAKIIIILGFIFLVYSVFEIIYRENARKEQLNVINEYFGKSFTLEEELKDQYDEDFLIKIKDELYIVTVEDNKVTKVKKQLTDRL
jgi:spermidine/putrescine-binding protein